ncbi:hypothetical protein CEXT_583801 [Caerostris extrusa]|uniref:Ycf15 n=1 Tax=Caerostris extrusa TaxID=172846 RepID=A0AAV4VII9_CAEEX|nr:hypothetical protein CEXT_583801 [Caerostris extrusa]
MRKYYSISCKAPSFMSSDGRMGDPGNRSSWGILIRCCPNKIQLSKEIQLFRSSNWALPFPRSSFLSGRIS